MLKHFGFVGILLLLLAVSGCLTGDTVIILDNDELTSTTYYPYSVEVKGGTDLTLDINTMKYYDNNAYEIQEGMGANPLTVDINFIDVSDFGQIVIREYYKGSSSHHIQFELWDYTINEWESYFDIVGQSGYTIITLPVYDANTHISDGNVQFRLTHIQNGISSHDLNIDFVWLLEGNNVGASTNLEGYAKYDFGNEDFNGEGDFTTTGDLNGNIVTADANLLCTDSVCYDINDLNNDTISAGDNLGDHTATEALDMGGFDIYDVGDGNFTKNVNVDVNLHVKGNATFDQNVRINVPENRASHAVLDVGVLPVVDSQPLVQFGGPNSIVTGNYGIGMGINSQCTVANCIAIGQDAYSTANGCISIGQFADCTADGSLSLGRYADAFGVACTAIMDGECNGNESIAIGGITGGNYSFSTLGGHTEDLAEGSYSHGWYGTTSGAYSWLYCSGATEWGTGGTGIDCDDVNVTRSGIFSLMDADVCINCTDPDTRFDINGNAKVYEDFNVEGTFEAENIPDVNGLFDHNRLSLILEEIGTDILNISFGLDSDTTWKQSVLSKSLSDPPGAPSEGDRYIVGVGGGWCDASWTSKIDIEIDNSYVSSTGYNLWTYTIPKDSNVFSKSLPTGDDIFFADENCVKLPHRFEIYNQISNTGLAKIKLTSTTDQNQTISLYYENSSASDQQATKTELYDKNYGINYEMIIDGSDSSANERDVVAIIGDPTQVIDPNFGYGVEFDGTEDAWSLKDEPYFETVWNYGGEAGDSRRSHCYILNADDVSTRGAVFAEGGNLNGALLGFESSRMEARWWSESKGWTGEHFQTPAVIDTNYFVCMSFECTNAGISNCDAGDGNYSLFVNGTTIGTDDNHFVMNAHSGDGSPAGCNGGTTCQQTKDWSDGTFSTTNFTGTIYEIQILDVGVDFNWYSTWYNNWANQEVMMVTSSEKNQGGATGDWANHENDLTEYISAVWTFETPETGWAVLVEDELRAYVFNSEKWIPLSSEVFHNLLNGLQGCDVDTLDCFHLTASQYVNATNPVNDGNAGLMTPAMLGILEWLSLVTITDVSEGEQMEAEITDGILDISLKYLIRDTATFSEDATVYTFAPQFLDVGNAVIDVSTGASLGFMTENDGNLTSLSIMVENITGLGFWELACGVTVNGTPNDLNANFDFNDAFPDSNQTIATIGDYTFRGGYIIGVQCTNIDVVLSPTQDSTNIIANVGMVYD